MEFVSCTFLETSEYVQNKLSELTLHEQSGMGKLIQGMRQGGDADCKILYAVEDGTIVAWLTCTDKPRFYWNIQDNPNRPEVQIYVHESVRRKGIGRSLLSQARSKWGPVSTCAWDAQSHEFFRSTR